MPNTSVVVTLKVPLSPSKPKMQIAQKKLEMNLSVLNSHFPVEEILESISYAGLSV
jgi:hypothetical protein